MYPRSLLVFFSFIVLLVRQTKQACKILNLPLTQFNGTIESNQKLKLEAFSRNFNFSLNFALKLELTRLQEGALDSNKLYQIANVNNILKIYIKNYAGQPTLYFHLLASLDPKVDLKHFPIQSEEVLLVTVMKNSQVN